MRYSSIKEVVILGIGGRGAYYIAKFLHLLGVKIEGYDLKESERTKELENQGIKIHYRNPNKGESFNCDLYLYTNDLNTELQEDIRSDNRNIERHEIGKFYKAVIKDFESKCMDVNEIKAFKLSNIAPLFNIDTGNTRYISVTGTDGKTTTCTMIYHLLKNAGFKPLLITTVAAYIGNKKLDTGLHTTTPSSQEIYELLKQGAGCTHVIIEATSHGLEQGRLAGLKFDTVGYTNITSEHLDYHGDWDSYCKAKSLLVTDHLKENGLIVLNKDDRAYGILKKKASGKDILSYSIQKVADLTAKDISEDDNGVNFSLFKDNKRYPARLPILGKYNVSNFLCALGICINENLGIENMLKSILSFETIKGRMEILQRKPFTVVVDYAHTTNAVEKALSSARLLVKGESKLIHVFGCAGRRDFYKRPEMGKTSNELSDITILTAEDPRMEDLKDINNQIEGGWNSGENSNAKLLRFDYTDKDVQVRADAIKKALEIAGDGDVVIITGKGHEESLCFGQIEYPWNDIDETKKLLGAR